MSPTGQTPLPPDPGRGAGLRTYPAPEPVAVIVDVPGVGLTVQAADVSEATADLRAHNPARGADVELAARTTLTFADGRLVARSPRTTRSRLRSLFGGGDRVDLHLTVPAGSSLEVRGWGEVTSAGPLGSVDIDIAMGDLDLERVLGPVRAKTSMGDIRVGSCTGPAELRTSAGAIEVGWAGAEVSANTSAGDVRVDHAEGELRLSTSAGDVRVERAETAVNARTSAGDLRIGSVRSGEVHAEVAYGRIEIGVAAGTAAWLEVEARHGTVRSELDASDGPGSAELTVEIRATTTYGDIVLRRA